MASSCLVCAPPSAIMQLPGFKIAKPIIFSISNQRIPAKSSRSLVLKAIKEWHKYEDAVREKVLARVLRFLKTMETRASSAKSRKSADRISEIPDFLRIGVIFRAAFKILFYILGGLAGFRSNPHKACYQTAPKHYPLRAQHGRIRARHPQIRRTTPSSLHHLSCDLPLPSCSPYSNPENTLDPLTYDAPGAIERGDYAAALSSDAARLVFSFANSCEFDDSTTSAALFYSQVERSIDAFFATVPPRNPGCEFSTRGLMPTRSIGLRWCFVLELQPFSLSCNRMCRACWKVFLFPSAIRLFWGIWERWKWCRMRFMGSESTSICWL
ncbi:uncharacterized protein LOC110098424 [Dendrobium catenatum]|uniref:uncharacterized protein LOC110098424 n=1 Tax=Dendrobium catenatum TaxID=906689 RepID=UPI0009F22536|nr:uncharacterized protein LOC110098424 [Dendrobium catenatum]